LPPENAKSENLEECKRLQNLVDKQAEEILSWNIYLTSSKTHLQQGPRLIILILVPVPFDDLSELQSCVEFNRDKHSLYVVPFKLDIAVVKKLQKGGKIKILLTR